MPMIQDLLVFLVAALSISNVTASPMLPPRPSKPTPATITPAPTSAGDNTLFIVTTPAPDTGCTTKLFAGHKFGPLRQETCTFYDSYTTVTDYVDCGGCSLIIQAMGAGPAVQCSTDTTLPLGTTTMTTCSPSSGSSSTYADPAAAPSAPAPTSTPLPDSEPPQ